MDPTLLSALIGLAGQGGLALYNAIQNAQSKQERDRLIAELEGKLAQVGVSGESEYASQLGAVGADPTYKAAQLAALQKLQDVGSSGGLDLAARAQQNEAMGEAARNAQVGQNSILQTMQARGTGGSGAELAAMLSNQQAAAQRQSSAGLQSVAGAQRRALEAMMQAGAMAGNMRNQDFGEKSQAARARDEMNRYNNSVRQRGYDNRMGQFRTQADLTGMRMGNQQKYGEQLSNTLQGGGQAFSRGAQAVGDYYSKRPGQDQVKYGEAGTVSLPYGAPSYRAPEDAYRPAQGVDLNADDLDYTEYDNSPYPSRRR